MVMVRVWVRARVRVRMRARARARVGFRAMCILPGSESGTVSSGRTSGPSEKTWPRWASHT